MHESTARQRHLVEPFRDHTVFVQLRVDPFYRRVQERCPDVAEPVASLIEQLLTMQEALCHGDYSPKNILAHGGGFTLVDYEIYSPKNILAHGGGFTLVDYETAHLGDP